MSNARGAESKSNNKSQHAFSTDSTPTNSSAEIDRLYLSFFFLIGPSVLLPLFFSREPGCVHKGKRNHFLFLSSPFPPFSLAARSYAVFFAAMRFSPSQPSLGLKGRQMRDTESSSRASERETFSSEEEKK
jgi:hypothetical protein